MNIDLENLKLRSLEDIKQQLDFVKNKQLSMADRIKAPGSVDLSED